MLKKWGLTKMDEQPSKEAQPAPPMADLITSAGSIKSVDNSIFFYCDIHTQSCAELNRLLREVDSKLQQAKMIMNEEDFIPTIHLRINSYGGDLFAGISTVDTIRELKSRVYTYVEGAAASAATIISIAGKKRFIGKNAFMLIHQLSSVCAGTYEQMNDGQENNKRLMSLIKNLYKQYTKIPMKELDSILKHDLWMDSDTCLKFGLVDKVL
jgi:ATP-dependent protease ClpP protease subunit